MKRLLPTLFLLTLASACQMLCSISSSESEMLDVTDYDRSCLNSSDCIAVPVGTFCDACGPCNYEAINRTESSRYTSDKQNISCCPDSHSDQAECSPCRVPFGAECKSGVCEVVWEEPEPSSTPWTEGKGI